MTSSVKEATSCPCKFLPRSLSSFTAAEYGDIHSLSNIKDISSRRDDAGYNPLHFAAQFNHVAATVFLLQLRCPVDGGGHCGATPLHRASFSGATAAMKVLLEWNNNTQSDALSSYQARPVIASNDEESSNNIDNKRCNLLAKDTSFGDESTPLHKATAGGRYLAVHMILEALRERDDTTISDELSEASQKSSWLRNGLRAIDKYGRTPLDVAQHCYKSRDTERHSVARWDAVAGGFPDWEKCVQLLRNADDEASNSSSNRSSSNGYNSRDRASGMIQQQIAAKKVEIPSKELEINNRKSRRLPRLPMHLTRGVMTCLDCDPSSTSGGAVCLTAKWQTNFQQALGDSVSMCIFAPTAAAAPTTSTNTSATIMSPISAVAKTELEKSTRQNTTVDVSGERSTRERTFSSIPKDKKITTIDSACARCQKPTVAFYPLPGLGTLVCKRCRRLEK
mmetsp:Transcript_12375/g.25200  ORF Transcript_12375/g.25200 Transcript_12375/m.25200 type:complete len:451 (-) Transcript_12375:218-1570(-)